MVYSWHSAGATPELLPRRETYGHMATTDLFWNLFALSGSVSAYLAYRQTKPARST